jgi:endonuclease/exonuclease/phosphatase family metal-dependent hydrolase
MRVATFNLENLDVPLGPRALILRPALERLEADVVCLQEVNGQHIPHRHGRVLQALDELLAETQYAAFHRASTEPAEGAGAADVHNLVTLSRFPIAKRRQVHHSLVPPVEAHLVTAEPKAGAPLPIRFDRPILLTELDVRGIELHVINVHLRAPLATSIPGGKSAPFVWKSAGQWAEGYFLSSLKRAGQALELRLLIDQLFDANPQALVLAAGDFNAEDHETPLRITVGAAEDTGNQGLTARAMVVLDRALDPARRFSILHHGRPQMVDHMLASHALYGHFRDVEIHNEAVGDEALAYAKHIEAVGSYHAALVAEFAM